MTTSQMEMQLPRASLNVAVTVATLRHQAERSGYVIVFEDLSDLLKAQKQAAWREVARRVAHEIKNPLTPIALVGGAHSAASGPGHAGRSRVARRGALLRGNHRRSRAKRCAGWWTNSRPSPAFPRPNRSPPTLMRSLRMRSPCSTAGWMELACTLRWPPICPRCWPTARPSNARVANLVDNAAEASQDSRGARD